MDWKIKVSWCRDNLPYTSICYAIQVACLENGQCNLRYCVEVAGKGTDLLYLETHVADTCNLKCRGCMHFSNIAIHPNYPDLQRFEQDFKRLSELFQIGRAHV